MIYATDTDITAFALVTKAKFGQNGLTVTCNVTNPAGTLIAGAHVTVTEVDSVNQRGVYKAVCVGSQTSSAGNYLFQFRTTDTTVDQQDLSALVLVASWVNFIDASVASRLPTASYTAPDNVAIAAAVWSAGTRTLTTFGSLVADIWTYSTRTLTAFIIGFLATVSSIQNISGSVVEEQVVSGTIDVENL